MSLEDLPSEAHLTALASLPGMGPRRLRILAGYGPRRGWAIASGEMPAPDELIVELGAKTTATIALWRQAASTMAPEEMWKQHCDAGIGIAMLGSAAMPNCLAADIEPPLVLFHTGRLDLLAGARVAVVGTRKATRYGLDIARDLGRDLSACGVQVVSGLAAGIDAAAHTGTLLQDGGAPPVAVVGSGLDIVYPRSNRSLWEQVVAAGLVMSEYPLGVEPAKWRFPARNRLIAAMSDAVVVVESRLSGGSMYTADEACRRDIPVLAVPGSIRSPASQGTNELLNSGCAPCRGIDDVLAVLGMSPSPGAAHPVSAVQGIEQRGVLSEPMQFVLDALQWQPTTFDGLLSRTGMDPGSLAVHLSALVARGDLELRGGWYERIVQP